MTETSRPPGLDQLTKDGVRLAGRLALGLASVPLLGLALLTGGRGEQRAPNSTVPSARDDGKPAAGDDPQPNSTAPSDEGHDAPPRADLEVALQTLTEATLPKPAKAKRKASVKRAPHADGGPAPSSHAAGVTSRRETGPGTKPRAGDAQPNHRP